MKNVKSQDINPSVQKLMVDLESNLGSALRKSSGNRPTSANDDARFSSRSLFLIVSCG